LGKYTLIITEKPDAANRVAMALNLNGKPKRLSENGVPYFSANNDEIIVAPALGHLYTVASIRKGEWDYPVFDYRWVPRYLAERGASRVRVWLKVISKLAENAETFIDACDYDIEGSIIGYCILKYACGNKEKTAKRMKYSTLTKEELQEAFNHLLPNLDFPQIEAGLARHEVDWLYGINLSRALTKAAKSYSGQYATLSTGRVQGPTLKFLEIREKTIRSFVPTPYWSISAKINVNGSIFEVAYEKNVIENKQEAEIIRDSCKKKDAEITKITLKEFEQNPPVPFDLGTLQSESYRLFKYTPMRTSNIAQHLYINALISYPRTSSQKLPPSIGYQKILKNLSKAASYQKIAFKLLAQPFLKPNEGKKIDPAHPAIYPTGNLPEKLLDATERNVYDLIVKRFLAVFGEPAIKQSVNVTVNINDYFFIYSGARTLSEGWMEYYRPYVHLTDVSLPPLNEGQKVQVKKITLKDYFTKPLPRYNPRSLLMKMEKEELGTKATRASTIQTLYDRKYLQGRESMVVTELGFEVIEVLRKYCPTVVSSKMTKMLEQKMDQIYQGQVTKEAVVKEAVEILKPVTLELKEKEAVIGASLSQALQKLRLDERTIGKCPKCQSGKLLILRSKKTGKRFVGCTNYFEHKCDAAYPLPQKGVIKTSGVCKICGCPTIRVFIGIKRPWCLCLNTNCPSKKEKVNREL
jgi:DNA topoisomerase-1